MTMKTNMTSSDLQKQPSEVDRDPIFHHFTGEKKLTTKTRVCIPPTPTLTPSNYALTLFHKGPEKVSNDNYLNYLLK